MCGSLTDQFHVCEICQIWYMSLVMRKPAFCICENKDADQLCGNREADQRLCFRYTDSTIPLLPSSEISSLWPSSVGLQPGLCRTWSKTLKTGFLKTRLIFWVAVLWSTKPQVHVEPSLGSHPDENVDVPKFHWFKSQYCNVAVMSTISWKIKNI